MHMYKNSMDYSVQEKKRDNENSFYVEKQTPVITHD